MSKDLGLWPPFANTANTTHGYLVCHWEDVAAGPYAWELWKWSPPLLNHFLTYHTQRPGATRSTRTKRYVSKARLFGLWPPVYLSAAAMSKALDCGF